jgi:hypothetical protein
MLVEKVENRLKTLNHKRRQMILPHCTWEKFGEILAINGGRIYGLFDELISFFSTMNICIHRQKGRFRTIVNIKTF